VALLVNGNPRKTLNCRKIYYCGKRSISRNDTGNQ